MVRNFMQKRRLRKDLRGDLPRPGRDLRGDALETTRARMNDVMNENTVTKAAIIDEVYERVNALQQDESEQVITKKEASEYVEAVLETMKDELARGQEIKVSGFGKFEVRSKGRRMGRNPRTNVEIEIPARCVLRFKVSQVLKDRLNGKR